MQISKRKLVNHLKSYYNNFSHCWNSVTTFDNLWYMTEPCCMWPYCSLIGCSFCTDNGRYKHSEKEYSTVFETIFCVFTHMNLENRNSERKQKGLITVQFIQLCFMQPHLHAIDTVAYVPNISYNHLQWHLLKFHSVLKTRSLKFYE